MVDDAVSRIPIIAKRGIYLPEAGLWLDPWDRQDLAFVSHAHSDHFGAHRRIIASKGTASLIEARFRGRYTLEPHMFGRAWTFNDHRLMLLPAGHTLGSAQIHITRLSDGATLLYTGDFKLRSSRTSEPTRAAEADTLIIETTFGLPHFRFPSLTKTRNALIRFCRDALDEGETPVLLGYALGKAQEILAQLAEAGLSFVLHPSVFEMTEAYVTQGIVFPPYEALVADLDLSGKVLVVPPSAARSQGIRKIKARRLAMCSGWALTPGAKFRYQVDEVFPLSDHADYPELLDYVAQVNPRLVLTTHGYAAEFARDLRERGYEAWSLGADDQMEFAFGLAGGAGDQADEDDETTQAAPASEFGRFVSTCDEVVSAGGRLRKIELLAAYFRALDDEAKTVVSARFFCGRPAATREEQRLIATGWGILRMALLNVSAVGVKRYRDLAASHQDTGRIAYMMLLHGQKTSPRPMSLDDITICLRRLMEARGPVAKSGVLEAYFRQMTPVEGQYLVKILTGDMRIGLKDALVEEALAAAFDADTASVREAHMLTGDIGETARLAVRRMLDTACLTVFQPLRPMLALPEESAQAVWERMVVEREEGFRVQDSGLLDGEGEGTAHGRNHTSPPATVWIEDQLGGIRTQLHKRGRQVDLFSRDLESLGATFADVIGPATQLADDLVLDGEIVAYREGKKLDLQALQERFPHREPDFFITEDVPVRFVVMDLLWHNGESLLTLPLRERRARLESVVMGPPFERIAVTHAHSVFEIEAALLASRRRGNDGLIAKDQESLYTAGRRGRGWVRLSLPVGEPAERNPVKPGSHTVG